MDSPEFWLAFLASIVACAAIALLLRWLKKHDPRASVEFARAVFAREKAQLEAQFFKAASVSGKPRGLRWKECQWNELIAWVRDKASGQLLALVGVTISFEAIEGGDMEGVEAVGNLRNATAVFIFDGEWRTAGRVVFNLNPDEAVVHFKDGYERVET